MVSDYVENASLSDARKAASGITDVVLGGASSLAVSVFGDAAVERVKEEVVDASAALVGLFPESHRPDAKALATSVALGLGGLAVGVPFVPGITDNLLVGGVRHQAFESSSPTRRLRSAAASAAAAAARSRTSATRAGDSATRVGASWRLSTSRTCAGMFCLLSGEASPSASQGMSSLW